VAREIEIEAIPDATDCYVVNVEIRGKPEAMALISFPVPASADFSSPALDGTRARFRCG